MDPAGRIFHAVVAGQTWHWIDPVAGAAKAAVVLRPRGLAVFWNVGNPDPEVAAGFAEVYRAINTGLPSNPWATPMLDAYEQMLSTAVEGIRAVGALAEPERLRFDWQTILTHDAWLEQVPTAGGHSRIPADRLAALLEGLRRIIDEHGGSFTLRYATLVVTIERRQRAAADHLIPLSHSATAAGEGRRAVRRSSTGTRCGAGAKMGLCARGRLLAKPIGGPSHRGQRIVRSMCCGSLRRQLQGIAVPVI